MLNIKCAVKKVAAITLAISMPSLLWTGKPVYAKYDKYPDKNVFALKEDLLPSWGAIASNESSETTSGQDGSNQKILFGKEHSTGKCIPWWIASRVLMDGRVSEDPGSSSHMMLYAAQSVAAAPFSNNESEEINVADIKGEYKEELKYLSDCKKVSVNHYGVSDCRRTLKSLLSSSFSKGEKSVMKDLKMKTFDTANKVEYIVEDKLCLPSTNKSLGVMSWTCEDIGRCNDMSLIAKECIIPFNYSQSKNPDSDVVLWSRSADADRKTSAYVAVPALDKSKVQSQKVAYNFELMPVAKVSVESLLFASSASSINVEDKNTSNGKFTAIDSKSQNYGMSLKFSANGTNLTDAFVTIDSQNESSVRYGNVPKGSYLTVCAMERKGKSVSYTTSIPLNEDEKSPSGSIDLSRLDSSIIGQGKNMVAQVWIEYQREDGLSVATVPRSTCFKTGQSLCIENVSDKVYDGECKVFDDIVVKLGESTLQKETDFCVKYFSNKDAGTGLIVVKGKGSYEGYISPRTFLITPATPVVTLKDKACAFDGEQKIIDPACIKDSKGQDIQNVKVTYKYFKDRQCKQKLCSYTLPNKNFKIPAKAPKELGTYYVKAAVEAFENYKGTESDVVEIVIKESL